MRKWINSGEPWIWMTAGAVALSLVAVYAVVWMTAAQGLGHWWPRPLVETTIKAQGGTLQRLVGEVGPFDELVGVIDVGLVVFPVVILDSLGRYMRRQCITGIG